MTRGSLAFLTIMLLCCVARADGADGASPLSYDTYLKQLSTSNSLVFSSSCVMMNGHRGVMLFQQSQQFGMYFEVNGDKTIRSEQLINKHGGFLIGTESGTRFFDKGDQPIRTLIESPYSVLNPYELDSIPRVPPQEKCYEQDQ